MQQIKDIVKYIQIALVIIIKLQILDIYFQEIQIGKKQQQKNRFKYSEIVMVVQKDIHLLENKILQKLQSVVKYILKIHPIKKNIVCDNKDKDDPIIKDECNDKTKKEQKKDNCLECKDKSKIIHETSNWWYACLIACIICLIISLISFGVYATSSPVEPEMLGGSSNQFKKFKKFVKSLFK
jgi:hypothetical protein